MAISRTNIFGIGCLVGALSLTSLTQGEDNDRCKLLVFRVSPAGTNSTFEKFKSEHGYLSATGVFTESYVQTRHVEKDSAEAKAYRKLAGQFLTEDYEVSWDSKKGCFETAFAYKPEHSQSYHIVSVVPIASKAKTGEKHGNHTTNTIAGDPAMIEIASKVGVSASHPNNISAIKLTDDLFGAIDIVESVQKLAAAKVGSEKLRLANKLLEESDALAAGGKVPRSTTDAIESLAGFLLTDGVGNFLKGVPNENYLYKYLEKRQSQWPTPAKDTVLILRNSFWHFEGGKWKRYPLNE